jgi:hypothetical protein
LANLMLAVVEANGFTYIKMHVGDPGPNGTANPAAETRRMAVDWGAPSGAALVSVADTGLAAVAATEVWTHYSLWSNSTAGTFGHSGTISPKAVTAGDDVNVPAGSVSLTFPVAA